MANKINVFQRYASPRLLIAPQQPRAFLRPQTPMTESGFPLRLIERISFDEFLNDDVGETGVAPQKNLRTGEVFTPPGVVRIPMSTIDAPRQEVPTPPSVAKPVPHLRGSRSSNLDPSKLRLEDASS